jgi:CO/xanthine dehydrogenase FAD-binding subunit
MTVVTATSLDEALDALANDPSADVLAGGTDFMVEVSFAHRRPASIVTVRRVDELKGWWRDGPTLVIGAGMLYRELETEPFLRLVPGLAQAARTVGSPQIRNAGTIGGNVATGSPAGDTLPILAALDADIVLQSAAGGERRVPWNEFFTGPKRTVRRGDELVTAVRLPVFDGRQEYLKVGTRNAMVISVAGVAVVVDADRRTVAVGLGSVGPVPLRAPAAEAWIAERVDWPSMTLAEPVAIAEQFGTMVASAASPIDDQRSTAAYRRHAVGVCAARALLRCLP